MASFVACLVASTGQAQQSEQIDFSDLQSGLNLLLDRWHDSLVGQGSLLAARLQVCPSTGSMTSNSGDQLTVSVEITTQFGVVPLKPAFDALERVHSGLGMHLLALLHWAGDLTPTIVTPMSLEIEYAQCYWVEGETDEDVLRSIIDNRMEGADGPPEIEEGEDPAKFAARLGQWQAEMDGVQAEFEAIKPSSFWKPFGPDWTSGPLASIVPQMRQDITPAAGWPVSTAPRNWLTMKPKHGRYRCKHPTAYQYLRPKSWVKAKARSVKPDSPERKLLDLLLELQDRVHAALSDEPCTFENIADDVSDERCIAPLAAFGWSAEDCEYVATQFDDTLDYWTNGGFNVTDTWLHLELNSTQDCLDCIKALGHRLRVISCVQDLHMGMGRLYGRGEGPTTRAVEES